MIQRLFTPMPGGGAEPSTAIPALHFAAGFLNAPSSLNNANGGGAFTPHGGTNPNAAFWFQASNPQNGTYQSLFCMGDGTVGTDVLGVHITPAGLIGVWSSNGGAYSETDSLLGAIPANTWFYLVAEWGGFANMSAAIYDLNGVTGRGGSAGSAGVQVNVTKQVQIGLRTGATGYPFSGLVDSFGFWPQGIPAALKGGAGGFDPLWNGGKAIDAAQVLSISGTNLAAFYNVDDPSGSTSYADNSGHGNPLTQGGGVIVRKRGAGF